ncbi:hypothetical protein ACN20G_10370 [Streptomyces sp. BI20]|uniref:hypothetical protein n=1 Tax=Streptomyces sp. BI20 TaxID=3403460 RepID=UPI003C76EE9D
MTSFDPFPHHPGACEPTLPPGEHLPTAADFPAGTPVHVHLDTMPDTLFAGTVAVSEFHLVNRLRVQLDEPSPSGALHVVVTPNRLARRTS